MRALLMKIAKPLHDMLNPREMPLIYPSYKEIHEKDEKESKSCCLPFFQHICGIFFPPIISIIEPTNKAQGPKNDCMV